MTREQKVNSTQITLGGEGTTVTFTNVKDKTEWLSGDCYAENAWGDDGVSCTSTPEADVKTDPVENANLYYYYKDPRYALAAV